MWYETGTESGGALCFHLRITLRCSHIAGPHLLLSYSISNHCPKKLWGLKRRAGKSPSLLYRGKFSGSPTSPQTRRRREPGSKSGSSQSQVEQDNLGPGLQHFSRSAGITVGRPPSAFSRSCRMSVSPCSFVTSLLLYVLRCILCCTVFHFISASLPKPVNVSSSSAPSGTSTSGPGCAPSSMRPSKNSRPQMAQRPRGARLEDAHNPISPMDSTGSVAPRLTASDSGLILG